MTDERAARRIDPADIAAQLRFCGEIKELLEGRLGNGSGLIGDGEHPLPPGADLVKQLRELPQSLGAEDQVHYGCQQNVADSQRLMGMLREMGFGFTEDL